jgi:hypothetical protein
MQLRAIRTSISAREVTFALDGWSTLRAACVLVFTNSWNVAFPGADHRRALRKLVNEHLRCSAFANLSAYTSRKVFHHA